MRLRSIFTFWSTERNFLLARVFALEREASASAGDWSDRCLRNDWIVTRPSGIDDDSRKSALCHGRMLIKPIGLAGFIRRLIYAYLSRQSCWRESAFALRPPLTLVDVDTVQAIRNVGNQYWSLSYAHRSYFSPSSSACPLPVSFKPCWEYKYFTLKKPPINPSGLPCLHLGNEKRLKRRPSRCWSSHHKHPIKVPNNYAPFASISPQRFEAGRKAEYRQHDTGQESEGSKMPAIWTVCGANNGFPAAQAAAVTERFEPALHVKWLYLLKANNESSVSVPFYIFSP